MYSIEHFHCSVAQALSVNHAGSLDSLRLINTQYDHQIVFEATITPKLDPYNIRSIVENALWNLMPVGIFWDLKLVFNSFSFQNAFYGMDGSVYSKFISPSWPHGLFKMNETEPKSELKPEVKPHTLIIDNLD